MGGRERAMLDTFVELADSLTSGYDAHDFLSVLVERCTEVLGVTTAGVMLESTEGHLRLAAATSTEMEELEQAEIDNEDGPCHQAYRTGEAVVAENLDDSDAGERWPTVVQRMRDMGLKAVYAFPLRLRDDRLGALNLYSDAAGQFAEDDIRLAQAFADVATIGILQERKVTSAERRASQLQGALDTRVVIEQAKGIIAAELALPVDDAFQALRSHARTKQRRLHDVAQSVIDHGAGALET